MPIRGNVNTRIDKLAAGEFDAIVVALCGLERLGKADLATEILMPDVMLPAVGQGALAIECRVGDDALRQLLDPLHDPATAACVGAERAMLAALDGSCRTPIAGLAECDGGRLTLEGLLLKPDGSAEIRARCTGDIGDAAALGHCTRQRAAVAGGSRLRAGLTARRSVNARGRPVAGRRSARWPTQQCCGCRWPRPAARSRGHR